MENNTFNMVLRVISTSLVDKIMATQALNENNAMERLYASKLYEMLEREETKVWHYSVHRLYDYYEIEQKTGRLVLHEQDSAF